MLTVASDENSPIALLSTQPISFKYVFNFMGIRKPSQIMKDERGRKKRLITWETKRRKERLLTREIKKEREANYTRNKEGKRC